MKYALSSNSDESDDTNNEKDNGDTYAISQSTPRNAAACGAGSTRGTPDSTSTSRDRGSPHAQAHAAANNNNKGGEASPKSNHGEAQASPLPSVEAETNANNLGEFVKGVLRAFLMRFQGVQ
jgi:hypothetical protein